jgi:hypothetical protein
MQKPEVTAVGRLLKPKGAEPRKHQLIKVDATGKATIVKDIILR